MADSYKYASVMVVDDSAIDRFIISKVVTNAFFAKEVVEMTSGSLALAHLKQATDNGSIPELIFLDINMPEMDGFEFLAHYATLPDHVKSRSILMLSSSLRSTEIDMANSNPYVLKYLSKPLTKEDLNAL